MKYLRIVFIFGLALIIFAGCEKEQVQPDPVNNIEDGALKGGKVKKGKDHYVPFKASFDIAAFYNTFGTAVQKDFNSDWPFANAPSGMPKATYLNIEGSGKATHLGRTDVFIEQWWTKAPNPADNISFGQGNFTFTSACGDLLEATFWGTADHTDDSDGTEILLHGTFTGGTGKFKCAKGEFLWDGLFLGHGVPLNPMADPPIFPEVGTEMGVGAVTVSGSIKY